MPYLCARFGGKQIYRNACIDSCRTRTGGPKFNTAGSSRGMLKNYQLVIGRKEN